MSSWRLQVAADDVGVVEPAADSLPFGERKAGEPLLGLFHRLGGFPGRNPVLLQQYSFLSLLPLLSPRMTGHGVPSGGGFGTPDCTRVVGDDRSPGHRPDTTADQP